MGVWGVNEVSTSAVSAPISKPMASALRVRRTDTFPKERCKRDDPKA